MVLDEYKRKRRFERTPEPPPGRAPAPGKRFYIQRHQARRLHYDLRLEMVGALKSWAVPHGPTLDPGEKRLAVLVEDHPLDYGEFEGTIPAGNYGAGKVTVWDKGTYEVLGDEPAEKQLERGDFKFRLWGHKLSGDFALVRMKGRGKGNEWLLIKKKDGSTQPGYDPESDLRSVRSETLDPELLPGAAKAAMPARFTPMLATPSSALPEGPDWLYEVKWDGWRAVCFLATGKKPRLVSRNGNSLGRTFPELHDLPHQVNAQSAILDGEVVAFDERGRPNFSLLQGRIGEGSKAIRDLARATPVTLVAFDLPYLNGYDLTRVPLIERKRLLESILLPGAALRYSEHFSGNGRDLLRAARENGLEGVMAKRASSRYQSRRTSDWMKVKIVSQQEFVICGFTHGDREHFGSLVLGLYDGGKLQWVGNVGSGFDQTLLKNIAAMLKPLVAARCPFRERLQIPDQVTWVKPQLVCTVRFSSWTADQRLRAPVFAGLRPDLTPEDCVREVPKDAGADAGQTQPAQPSSERPRLDLGSRKEAMVTVDGRRLKLSNLDKIFYPREGYRKRDVILYYDVVAELILPHLKGRPLSLKRYPNGIAGKYFFQKDAPPSFADWLRTEAIYSEHNQAPIRFVLAEDRASLLYLANLGCIDHNPWMSRVGSLDRPDFILIDLDPVECGYDRIVEAALEVRKKLDVLGLEGCPKTTGGDGMHIYVPLEPRYSYEQTRTFGEILARLLASERPDLFTTPRAVARREKGKVYFDYLQNAEGQTIAAPYVLRAYPGAPVSTPLRWEEVASGLTPERFRIKNVFDRFARLGDLFQPVLNTPQRLEPALKRLEKLVQPRAGKR